MLDLTPQALWEEATEAIEYQRRRVSSVQAMIEAYQTPWHVGSADPEFMARFDSRNHAFEFIALTIAQVVFDNPRWQVTADRGYAAEMEAPALQAGLNKWTKDVRLRKTLARLYVDYCFHSCTSLVTLDGKVPKLRRIGLKRAFRDHRCFDMEDCRYQGHQYILDKGDLDGPEWNREIVEQMTAGVEDLRGVEQGARDRNEVALFDIWVPEAGESDATHNGMIYTLPLRGLAGGDKLKAFPRKPRRAFCGSHGPYQFGGTYPVPDDVMPLSQLIAVQGQNKQNNDVARAFYDSIVGYKRIILASGNSPALASKVKRAKHGAVISTQLQDVARMIAQIELGGPTPAMAAAVQYTQDGMDRSSGMSNAMRGDVTGDATAYENSVAMAGTTARAAYPKQQFTDFTGEIGQAVAWLMRNSSDVVIDLPAGAGLMLGGNPSAHAMAVHEQLAQHGIPDDVIESYIDYLEKQHRATPFETFGFNVEPLSTERASDPANRARIAALMPMVMPLMQMGPAMPWMNTKEMLGAIGQAFDMPDLARIYDQNIAAQAGAMQMQAQMASGEQLGTQTTPAPRLSADIAPPAQSKPTKQRKNTRAAV